jgi:uncharacterized protein (TIGR03084 family)
MLQEAADLLPEAEELHGLLATLSDEDWRRPTTFKSWTPWDVVAHLHMFDRVSLLALEGGEPFVARRAELVGCMQRGETLFDVGRRELGAYGPAELRARWIETCRAMAAQLGASDPDRRLPWFGPDMGVRMFTTARLMETWAHGQEIYDLMQVERTPTDRIRHVCVIGVKTFGWTFANRGQKPPGPAPHVRLVAPSGAVWEWNETSESGRVEGDAFEFAEVVAQTRNVADTKLRVTGDVAERWMAIAQCFAGGPVDPPEPGTRSGR